MDKPKAVNVAYKLAWLIYSMLTKGEQYTDQGQANYEERYRERVLHRSDCAPKNWACNSSPPHNRHEKPLQDQTLEGYFLPHNRHEKPLKDQTLEGYFLRGRIRGAPDCLKKTILVLWRDEYGFSATGVFNS